MQAGMRDICFKPGKCRHHRAMKPPNTLTGLSYIDGLLRALHVAAPGAHRVSLREQLPNDSGTHTPGGPRHEHGLR
eukprot:scaffold148915_cov18-Tisochrysis_lutea.AAC.1